MHAQVATASLHSLPNSHRNCPAVVMTFPTLQLLLPPLLLHVQTQLPYTSGYLGFRSPISPIPTAVPFHVLLFLSFSSVTQHSEKCLRTCSSSSYCSAMVCESTFLLLMALVLCTHAVQGLLLSSVFKHLCPALVSAKVFQDYAPCVSERSLRPWMSVLCCSLISALFAQRIPAQFPAAA